jgi:hypothetical protein
VATAAGANLDLFRMNLFYQLSPLAHRQVDYPAVAVALAAYTLMAVGMLLLAAGRLDRTRPTYTLERWLHESLAVPRQLHDGRHGDRGIGRGQSPNARQGALSATRARS